MKTWKTATTAFVLLIFTLIGTQTALADGTAQVSPTNSADGAALLVAPDLGAGSYLACPDEQRVRFTISDNASENLYFGFHPRTYAFGAATTIVTNAYYRIYDETGTLVVGPTLIPTAGAGFINDYTEAASGPDVSGLNPAGYTPIVFNPTTDGDFYIEMYRSADGGATMDVSTVLNGRLTMPFFDFTVATTTNTQSIGRIWSREWSFVTTNLVSGNFDQALASSFTGDYFAYTPDQFVVQVQFQPGFRPLAYQIAMNFEGAANTGNFLTDRQSTNTIPTLAGGYQVFLTNPDVSTFPNGTPGNPAFTSDIFGCPGAYFIPYYIDQPGDVSITIELNGIPGYQPGTEDVTLEAFGQNPGNQVMPWNGLDGLGTPVPAMFTTQVQVTLYQGRTNVPMIDAEMNINGLSVISIFPSTGSRELYWDDSNITPFGTCGAQTDNVTTGGVTGTVLASGILGPTHAWNGSNPTSTIPAVAGGQGDATALTLCDDYGNSRCINTWFYAVDLSSPLTTMVLPSCDNDGDLVDDNIDIDDDNDGILDVDEHQGLPDPVADADGDGIPNYIDPDSPGFVDSNFDGVDDQYDADLDGIINSFDPDSDNDACSDVIEAGFTDPNGDGVLAELPTVVNGVGQVTGTNAIDGYTAPLDVAPANGVPDYLEAGSTPPDAGADQFISSTSATLAGNTPSGGSTALWTLVSGSGTITNPTDPNTTVTGLGIGTNVFQWTFTNACGTSSDQVSIVTGNLDSDNDLILDIVDLDDDNDGIYDVDEWECSPNPLDMNTPGYALNTAFNATATSAGTVDDLSEFVNTTPVTPTNFDFGYSVIGGANWNSGIRLITNGGITGPYLQMQPQNTDFPAGDQGVYVLNFNNEVYNLEFSFGGMDNSDAATFEAFNAGTPVPITPSNITNLNIPGADYTNIGNKVISTAGGANAPNNAIRLNIQGPITQVVIRVGKENGNAGNVTLQLYELTYCVAIDTDNDGTPDHLDTDSDGDGCNDVAEAGYTDQNDDGILGDLPTSVNGVGEVTGATVVDGYTGTTAAVTTFDATPSATISYSAATFCQGETTGQAVTLTGDTGGTFSAAPAGLTINAATGEITPNTSTVGSYTVTYTIAPNAAGCFGFTTTTTIDIGLCPPVANDDTGAPLVEDGANGVVAILSNDTDPDGTPAAPTNGAGQYTVDLDPGTPGLQTTFTDATGTWTYNPTTGDVTFDPANNYNGTATITYELCDPDGLCDQATISFTVAPVNDPPSQGNETMGPIAEDTPTATTSPNLTTNNIDPDGTATTVTTIVSSTGGGTTTITGGGTTIDYTPAAGFNGIDTVIYTVCDNGTPLPVECVNDTLFVTVSPVNDPPSQGNEFMTVNEDDPATTSPNVLTNNVDPDGTTTSVNSIGTPTGGGTVVDNGNGTFDYTPAPNFNGIDTIPYVVCDNGTPLPAECVNDTLFVTVNPVNDPPSQGNETMGPIAEDTPTATTSPNLTANNIDPDGTATTVTTVVSSTGGGTTTITGGGTTIDYTPAAGFNGIDTVIYTVCDNGTPLPVECVNDTLFVTVSPVNDPPSQGNETMGPIAEDTPTATTSPNLTTNNIDPDGTTTTVTTIVSSTGGGTTTITGGGTTIDYTPAPNFNGIDTVIYTVCDNGTPLPVECVNDTLFVTVSPVNDPPSQGNETMGPIAEDTPTATTSPNLTANNIDPDGTATTVTTVVSSTGGGTTTITGGGTAIDYTPAAGFNGIDTVIYTVCDNGTPLPVECVNDTLFVTVAPVNDPPSQGNEFMTVNEDDPATTSPNVLTNNVDPDGTTTSVNSIGTPTGGGTVVDNGNGTFDYTPAPNFNGIDTIPYVVCDNGTPLPAECVNDTLFVTVNPVNDPPVVDNEFITTPEDTPVSGDLTDAGDFDPDGTTLDATVTPIDGPNNGSIVINTDGTYTYTPDPNFTGNDTVVVEICDNGTPLPAECVNDTIFITVTPVNDPPSQGNETMGPIAEDTPTATTSPNLTANNIDPDGTTTTVTTIVSSTGGGTTTISGGGTTIDYTPAPNFNGIDTVIYTVCDNGTPLPVECVNDTLFVTVTPVNDPPIVDNEFITTPEDTPIGGDLTDAGDFDPDGTALDATVTPIDGPNNGSIVINTDGTYTYTPDPNFNGNDTVVVEICDNGIPLPPECVNDTIFITVTPVNDPPSQGNETMGPIAEDTPTATTSPNVLTNNVDPDGTTMSVSSIGTPTGGGTVVDNGNGTFDYTPAPNFNGIDTIPYVVCDNGSPLPAECVNDTLFVTVTPVNDPPSQGNETMGPIAEDTPTATTSPNLTANNIDPDGTTTTVTTIVSSTGGGTTVITGGGTTIDYTPAPNFNGIDTVIYTVCDNGTPLPVECVNDTLFVTVTPVNDPPSQGNETMGPIAEDTPTATTSPNVLTNNVDPDGTTTSVSSIGTPTGGGTVVDNGNGTFDYTPAPNFNGIDTIPYVVCDNGSPLPAECVNDTLFVTVTPVNDPPSQGNETMGPIAEDTPTATTSPNLTANNIDPDGTTTTVTTIVSSTGGGTTVITGGGTTIDYTPAPNFNGIDTVIYTVCDNGTPLPVECVNDTLFVTVTPVNDPPSQGNETMGPIAEDTPTATTLPNLTANNIDPDGTTTTVTTIVSSTGGGTTTITGGGTTIDYTPAAGFNGIDTVIYTVCDNGTPLPVECVNDTLFVTVTPVNDPPIVDNEFITTPEDTPIGGDLTDAGDFDPDGTTLDATVTPIDGPNNGSIVINTDGTYTYTPDPNFNGNDTVVVEICDNGIPLPPECVNDTIFITVTPVNDPPIVDNEFNTTSIGIPTSGDLTDAGDSDPDGTVLDANPTPISGPSNGTIVINTDGTFTYTPNGGFSGNDTVVVEICDNGIPLPPECVNDTIFITVLPCPSPIDSDSDGLTDCEETTGIDDPGTPDDPNNYTGPFDPNDPCLPIGINTTDSDNDGLTDCEETTGIDDPSTPDDPNNYGGPFDPNDPCLPIGINTTDSDNDGLTDCEETSGIDDPSTPDDPNNYGGPFDPNDPCLPIGINTTDSDNDGLTDCEETTGIDDPSTPDDPNNYPGPFDPNDPCLPIGINTTDSDNDGLTDCEETTGIDDPSTPDDPNNYPGPFDPNDPCLPIGINTVDSDNDGLTDCEETTGIDDPSTPDDPNNYPGPFDPNDPCLPIGINTTDSDNDGLTDCEETTGIDDPSTPDDPNNYGGPFDPNDPCLPIGINTTDSDNDGLTDCEETTGIDDPSTPDDPNNYTGPFDENDPCLPIGINTTDSDNDGLTDCEETTGIDDPSTPDDPTTFGPGPFDPNDPCDPVGLNTTDSDNDGLTDCEETTGIDDPSTPDNPGNYPGPFDPNDPCLPIGINTTDSDNDGLTDCEETTGIDDPSTPDSPGNYPGPFDPNDPCLPIGINTTDSDNDGLTDCEETTGIDDPSTPDDPNNYPGPFDPNDPCLPIGINTTDSDNDGLTDCEETTGIDDPSTPDDPNNYPGPFDPNDPCLPIGINTTDSDGDGLTDCEETTGIDDPSTPDDPTTFGPGPFDPNDPCDPVGLNTTDTDGDGLTDCEEITGIDDPSTPIVPNGPSDPNDPCDPIGINTTDSDNDGLTDCEELTGIDDPTTPDDPNNYPGPFDPNDPCLPIGINTVDSDNDGLTDCEETTGIDDPSTPDDPNNYPGPFDPNDPCLPIGINTTDSDNDGLTDCEETTGIDDPSTPDDPNNYPGPFDPNDPCLPIGINTVDSDGDGLTDCEETTGIDDPSTPDDPNNYPGPFDPNDPCLPIGINTTDSDGDGLTDCEELTGIDDPSTPDDPNTFGPGPFDPNDPCDPIGLNTVDTDGDGLTDCEEITGIDDPGTPGTPTGTSDPNDPCDPIGQVVVDTDGDGLSDCEELTGIDDPGTPGVPTGTSDPDDPCSPKPCGLDIPNGFTPGGDDNFNNTYVIEGIEEYPGNSIIIFNRWGNKVYETSDYANDWDGTTNVGAGLVGTELPTGTYYYILDTKDPSIGNEGVFQGFIYLKR